MRYRIGEVLRVRVPLSIRFVLRRWAKKRGVTEAEYVRLALRHHLISSTPQSEHVFTSDSRQSMLALVHFHSDVKHFILACREAYMSLTIASRLRKLPGTKRRDELEKLAWRVIQDAKEWMKTEQAAKDARARARAAEVLAHLMMVENRILDSRDESFVANLELELEELEASRAVFENKLRNLRNTHYRYPGCCRSAS